jgi:hypothetical protein
MLARIAQPRPVEGNFDGSVGVIIFAMKKLPLVLLSVGLLGVGSMQAEHFRPAVVQGAVIGGAVGAVIGHNDGRHTAEGAVIGAAAGAIIGSIVDGRHRPSAATVVVGAPACPPPPRVVYVPAAPRCEPPPRVVVVPRHSGYHYPRHTVVVRDCEPPVVVHRHRPARRVVYVDPAPDCGSRAGYVVVRPRRW